MDDAATIGARLRKLRKLRGKTLVQLGDEIARSPAYLSLAERGLRPLDSRGIIAKLAIALNVSESDLVGGPHLSFDPVQSGPHTHIPDLRVALQANSLSAPTIDRARTLAELTAEMTQVIEPLRRACDYITLGQKLPAVLDELHVHAADPEDEAAHRRALETLIEACVCATFTAKNLGYLDLAAAAAARAAEASNILGDPVQKGIAEYLRVQTLPRTAWERTLTVAQRAAGALQPHTHDQRGVEVLGMLTLSASLAAATLNDGAAAEHWLGEAQDLARRVPDEPTVNWQSFSRTNVGIWKVTVSVERGLAGGGVLELSRNVTAAKLGRSSRQASYFADVGRGLARDRKYHSEAITWLTQAESMAPQRIRNSPQVRQCVDVMLRQAVAAAGSPQLRGMAARMGIPH